MENSEKNICDVTPPVYILMPICKESKIDGFLNIIKNAINRAKPNELDNALKLGMSADKFSIELEDTTRDWNELGSKEQQIRQWKLLGFWAINNFPSLGKKLFGWSWQAPERTSLQVVGHSQEINAAEMDAIIFQKLKLRVLQLNTGPSTLTKFKHFVNVSINIGRKNECQVSAKIKSFDIEDEFLENCWKALKMGEFSVDVLFDVSFF